MFTPDHDVLAKEMILLPISSGMVVDEAVLRLPRQDAMQTREDMIEAGVRLANQDILYGPDNNELADPLNDLLPYFSLGRVLHQTTEIIRQRLVYQGKIVHERLAPLTPGAFYKAFSRDAQANTQKGGLLEHYQVVVAERLIDNAAPALVKPGPNSSTELDFSSELKARLNNPAYLFIGSLAV